MLELIKIPSDEIVYRIGKYFFFNNILQLGFYNMFMAGNKNVHRGC